MSQDVKHASIFSRAPLEVPNLFTGYRIGDYPRAGLRLAPWEITNTQAVLVNAFDLLANQRTRRAASEIREKQCKLHEFIEFDGPLMLDSGAFNFQKQTEISIDPLDVLKIGIELKADISVVLDHPFLPNAARAEIKRRWANTLENTQRMLEKLTRLKVSPNFQLMPVLHGHDADTLERSFEDILKIWGKEPPIIGIGSLAPLARNGSKRTVIDIICTVRRLLPNAHVHCFSLGSALLMLFAFYCGADTVDSQSWILSAAFKNVQLPGFPWSRFSAREKEKDPEKYEQIRCRFANHLLKLISEEKFTAKNWEEGSLWEIKSEQEAFSYLDYLEDQDGVNHIHRRACHNLYTFNFEASRVRAEKHNLENFISKRLNSTIYKKTFEHAIAQTRHKS